KEGVLFDTPSCSIPILPYLKFYGKVRITTGRLQDAIAEGCTGNECSPDTPLSFFCTIYLFFRN
ncbi:hypothetical protein, partial [Bacteroides sp. CAG:633]|uniref:hypothetical protein n=1 Tax=Bacteroides sp. CAG:633 TaxID=1262744 RepID=UPI0025861EF0